MWRNKTKASWALRVFSCLAFDEFVFCRNLKKIIEKVRTIWLSSTCATCNIPPLPKHALRVLLSHTDNCYVLAFIFSLKTNQSFIFFNTDHKLKFKKSYQSCGFWNINILPWVNFIQLTVLIHYINLTFGLHMRSRSRARMCKPGFDTLIAQPVASSYTDWASPTHRGLHNEQLYDLHSSPNIIRVVISRKMRWAGHVARMGDRRSA